MGAEREWAFVPLAKPSTMHAYMPPVPVRTRSRHANAAAASGPCLLRTNQSGSGSCDMISMLCTLPLISWGTEGGGGAGWL